MLMLSQIPYHDGSCHDCTCRVVAVIRTYMTYVWGFGVAKPVAGLQPQTVGADEDREGVRGCFNLQMISQLAVIGIAAPAHSMGAMPPVPCSKCEGCQLSLF